MKQEDLKNLTLEQLKKKEKNAKGFLYFFISLQVLVVILGIFESINEKKFSLSIISGLAFLAIIPSSLGNLKSIREEINSRG